MRVGGLRRARASTPRPRAAASKGSIIATAWSMCAQYNKGYNYFSGLPDEDVIQQQKSDATGNRPTWFVGVNSWARNRAKTGSPPPRSGYAHRFSTQDPFGVFGEGAPGGTKPGAAPRRPLKRLERKCMRQLNLDDDATKADIKTRFKELVKRLHPDHNNGDRSSEDKLREVIQAYNYLRQAGLA